ncbi:hypothetical protein [Reyranella sp.]|uniref:hypothetical protein n=1 Tax=Reyranella sp. TaxID=1929291 RepID=UPI00272F5080|nr:hypothetical protein [Reyranella sp.]MDP2372449.1 hypothetical protein [Reyranella sp.]
MCDPITMMTAGASVLSTALGVVQQVQRAQAQQSNYFWHDAEPDPRAALDEQRARLAEQEGEARVDAARQKTAQQLGSAQARLAAQGSDLSGSPLDVLGDIAAAGEEDALSLRYQAMRTAWENRVRASLRPAPTGYYERVPAGRVDPTLGVVRGLLS